MSEEVKTPKKRGRKPTVNIKNCKMVTIGFPQDLYALLESKVEEMSDAGVKPKPSIAALVRDSLYNIFAKELINE